MKVLVVIPFLSVLQWSSLCAQEKIHPLYQSVSKADIELVASLTPGKKILFSQNCIKNYNETVPNGIVQFQNLRVDDDRVCCSIEFKDTVVNKVIYYFNNSDEAVFTYFHVPLDRFTQLSRNELYQSFVIDNLEYICIVNRRKVTLIVTPVVFTN